MNKDDNKKTHIIVTGKGGGGSGSTDWNDITNKPNFANVATSGDYDDLENKPEIPAAQVNSDWNAASGVAQILNKPTIPTKTSELTNDSGFTTFDGDYNSLTNKPTIPAAQVNSDWNSNSGVSQILNKPSLATVATSGNYSDLNGTPTLATVATSGDYDDLQNKPTIPAAPVQSDWNEADSSSLAYIANKPTIPAAQVNSDWNAVSGVAQILNKPTIPTVPPMATETLTFTLQGDTTKTVVFYVIPNYFYVEDISGSDNTLSIKKNASVGSNIELFYSSDKINWVSMGTTGYNIDVTATIPANSKLYLKGNGDDFANTLIKASGNFNVGGNIMSLLYGDYFDGKTVFPSNSSTFGNVFYQSTKLINAKDLILPVTTLTVNCYQFMFKGCTALTTAPELPATTLAESCYNGMFQGCTSLTTAPELPATTLANSCYSNMFNGCTSLTTAPELPATTLANSCYSNMFKNCTSLTTAPVTLPATNTIGNNGYSNMFNGCTSLTTAPVLYVTTLPNSYGYYSIGYCEGMFSGCSNLNKITTYIQSIGVKSLDNWLNNVAASGDFYNLGGATFQSGAAGIPEGWTEHTSL